MKIAREGLTFILPSMLLAAVSLVLRWPLPASLFFLLSLAFLFFFRDPQRSVPPGEHLVVSPADGKVLAVEALTEHPEFPVEVNRISIFLSLYDVHIVRSPLSAEVISVEYHLGKFLPAYKEEAGRVNESNTLVLAGENILCVLKQIVGVAARRIKCYVGEKDRVARGQKIGLMYFGSRVEVHLPRDVTIKVGLNQKVKAGETVIAEVKP